MNDEIKLPKAWLAMLHSVRRNGKIEANERSALIELIQHLERQSARPVADAGEAWRGSLAQVVMDVPLPERSDKYQSGFVDAKQAILQALRVSGFDRAAPSARTLGEQTVDRNIGATGPAEAPSVRDALNKARATIDNLYVKMAAQGYSVVMTTTLTEVRGHVTDAIRALQGKPEAPKGGQA